MATILSLAGRRYVAGVFWSYDARGGLAAINAIASQLDYHHYCRIAADSGVQIGVFDGDALGASLGKSVHSLAAELATVGRQPGESIHFNVQLRDDLHYHLAIDQDGMIAAQGDEIGGRASIEEIAESVSAMDAMAECQAISAEDFDHFVSSRLTGKPAKASRIRKVVTPKQVVGRAIAVAVLAVVLIGGGVYYHQHNLQVAAAQRAEHLAQIRQARMEAERRKLMQTKHARIIHTHPWAKQALPTSYLSYCKVQYNDLDLVVRGWKLESWICRGLAGRAYYKEGPAGYSDWGRPLNYQNRTIAYVQTAAPSGLTGKIPQRNGRLLGAKQVSIALYALASNFGGHLSLQGSPQAQFYTPKGDSRRQRLHLPWEIQPFTYHSAVAPWRLGGAFNAIAGVRIKSVQLELRAGNISWITKGTAYVK